MKYLVLLTASILLLTLACKTSGEQGILSKEMVEKEWTQADKVLAKALVAHGGKRYETAHYEFIFRNKKYTFKNNKSLYQYTVSHTKDGKKIVDQLDNQGLSRMIDGQKVNLTEKEIRGYSNALNSVIYFATLPHKLQDPAVNKAYKGEATIKGKNYEVLEISFDEENGGQDHDDVFYYWINKETHVIDYLAYNYQVNGGGVRFRSAYDTRVVDGVLFQNYINYKAPFGTPLEALPALFEKGELIQLSLIETANVVNLK